MKKQRAGSKKLDFGAGFDLVVVNAKAHFDAAALLADRGYFGLANSHLILSAEEAVKAYMVFIRHYDSEAEIDDFNKFFKDHKHKHETIKSMTFATQFLEKMMQISIDPALELAKNKKKVSVKKILAARDAGVANLITWLKSMPDIDNDEDWWNNANTNKNKGFYVGLFGDKWQSPSEISKGDYEKSHVIVSDFLLRLETLPKAASHPDGVAFYEKFKKLREGKTVN